MIKLWRSDWLLPKGGEKVESVRSSRVRVNLDVCCFSLKWKEVFPFSECSAPQAGIKDFSEVPLAAVLR
jgi:hypothetical protein